MHPSELAGSLMNPLYSFVSPLKLSHIENFSKERVDWLTEKIVAEGLWTTALAISTEHNLVMDGQHRLEAALKLGLKHVPCFFFSYNSIKVYSLRPEINVNGNDIINNFIQNKPILPYKTAKHVLPSLSLSEPLPLKDLKF